MSSKNENIEAIYPLSPLQQGILYHSILTPDSAVYFEQLSCRITGEFNIEAFDNAWKEVIKRHTILRTAFVWKKVERMLQVVNKEVVVPIKMLDFSSLNKEEQESKIEAFICEDRQKGFQLSKAPLIRLTIIVTGKNVYRLIWSCHHLLLDGWSRSMLLNEVFNLYDNYCRSKATEIKKTAAPYQVYINWIEKQDKQKAENFWREKLKGFTAPTNLPKKSAAIVDEIYDENYKCEKLILDKAASDKLKSYARENRITINTVLQGVWALALSRYSSEQDIVFGVTVSGRSPQIPGIDTMMGLFINTIPFRTKINFRTSLSAWLKELYRENAEYREYEYSSLVDIHTWSEVPSGSPLFNTLFVFENYPVSSMNLNKRGNAEISDVKTYSKTNYPIALISAPEEELPMMIWYDERQYSNELVKGLLSYLKTLLVFVAETPEDKPLFAIPAVASEEFKKMLKTWNTPKNSYPDYPPIHVLFEQQVQKRPEATALSFEGDSLTYSKLNELSNKLAWYLIEKGVGPEVLVGIITERSLEMIIALLAVLKAGGAYLPIDPAYPKDRINYIIKDSGIKTILKQNAQSYCREDKSEITDLNEIQLDEVMQIINGRPVVNPDVKISSSNLAYVIYTSGSTGRPKGTLLQHKGLSNLVEALIHKFEISPESRLLQFASFSFDASVAEIFTALISGASLYLARRDTVLLQDGLKKLLTSEKISSVTFPPSLLNNLSEEDYPELKTVVSAGEACPNELGKKWSKRHRFVNGYGPTEATVGTCLYPANGSEVTKTTPIGIPIENVLAYVLDKNMYPVPVGVPGELFIGGIGLARGYINRPELTAEKFVPNPFSAIEGERLYKSGDLVRYLPDGILEFLGRVDNQVKLRGFRIELEEIEAVFNHCPEIKTAAVLLKENSSGEKAIVLFYEPADDVVLNTESLRNFAQKNLPEYMIPSVMLKFDRLPLSPNGKIDRKVLEKHEYLGDMLENNLTRPTTVTEELLEFIWSKILKLEHVGTENNFFELGGHSLKATQLVSQIREVLNVEVPLREIFNNPTIKQLAKKIESLRSNNLTVPEIELRKESDELQLSYSQERLWFLDQLVPNSSLYNIPVAVKIQGPLNLKALEYSIKEIVRRHEILRTVFINKNGKPLQQVKENISLSIQIDDMSDQISEGMYDEVRQAVDKEINMPFDLEKGPLFRVGLIKLQDDEYILLFVSHHIISDGWSAGIIINEFSKIYESYFTSEKPLLDELKIQYADYAIWQRRWLSGEHYERALNYWKEKLKGELPVLDLPFDYPRKAIQSFKGSSEKQVLPKEISERIFSLSRKEGVTPYMFLLAAFQLMLNKYTGNNDILVGTPIANRIRKELEELIGFFVNTLVIRTKFNNVSNFMDLLKQVRDNTIEAYEYQNMPFEKLVEILQPERNMSHSPIFQVAFIYQNFSNGKCSIKELDIQPFETESRVAKYDLSLTIIEEGEKLESHLEYNTELFERTTIKKMLVYFMALIERLTSKPKEKINEYSLLPEDELKRQLRIWNQTKRDYPENSSVHRLFETISEQHPEFTALTFSDLEEDVIKTSIMTYKELNEKANQLARYIIRQQKGGRGKLIGISMSRSFEMLISILAVLKSGGAFVPIDPFYPTERISYMLHDSRIDLLLTEQKFLGKLPLNGSVHLCVDSDWDKISAEEKTDLMLKTSPEDLAYVIYTSGSTGKPKGTLLHHQGLANLASAQKKAFKITSDSRILQFASLSFDASVWEIVMALLNEASLSIVSNKIISSITDYFINIVNTLGITTITVPPSLLAIIPEKDKEGNKTFSSLKTIIVAGEKCPAGLANRWSESYDFFNAYGPTETTVCATMNLCNEEYTQSTPIGIPVDNFQTYILDKFMNPIPVGVAGELYIGGPGLAYGYLNKPELSAEKFVPNPFCEIPGLRLYRTGDLAKYLPDGKIDFIGRTDNQVKIRGFRIEMDEIKSVITDYQGIKDAVVSTYKDEKGESRIVGYLVSEDNNPPDVLQLRVFMKKRLPEYMLPSVFMFIDAVPLTSNGKVDFKSLPAPELSSLTKGKFIEARTEDEKILSGMCSELLGIQKVGVFDNFFELGGHSLLAVQFISRIREHYKLNLPLTKLFENPCIADLAGVIESVKNSSNVDEFDVIERHMEEDIEKLINEIDMISDEEAKELLSKEMNPAKK